MTGAEAASDTWDLVVVGAGPAGAATALGALARDPDLRVLLLDRAEFPRDKSCGDGIAPHVLDALGEVGVQGLLDDRSPLRRLRISLGDRVADRPLARPVWVVPRADLDARLLQRAVAAGAALRTARVRRLDHEGGTVALDAGVCGRVVTGADGAYSVVRSAVLPASARRDGRRAVAIRGYVATPPELAGIQLIRYGERRQPSYAWCFDRGDGLANIGYGELVGTPGGVTRRLLLEELDRLLPGAAQGGHGWRAHQLPLSGWPRTHADGRVLLAGDAAHLVNPMTGEGIYYAVATGILAGRAAADALAAGAPASAGDRYSRSVRRLLATHQRHTAVAARLSAVPAIVGAGITAAARSQPVFDDLVEIGLGRGTITPRLAAGLVRGLVGARPVRRGARSEPAERPAHPHPEEHTWRS